MDGADLIGSDQQGAVLRLTLNNPPANALSVELMDALQAELDSARDDSATRVIVIAASGKLFSAGHDLKQMTSHRSEADKGEAFFEHTFALCSRLMQSIVEHPKPVIAEVDVLATAAGCQLVASCDLAFASDRAMDMLLTGEMIDAATALEFGLVNRVVASDALTETVNATARTIAAK